MRSRLVTFPALVAALFLVPGVALGHAELDTATPGPGDEVVGSPDEIVATFTQDLDMSRTTMTVRNAAGDIVAEDPVPGDGPRQLRLALPELAPGEYEVRWASFSAEDSELERGRYTFTVLSAPSPTAAPTAAPSDAPTIPAPTVAPSVASTPVATAEPAPTDSGVAVLLPIAMGLIVLVALGAWLLRRREPNV